MGQWTLIILLFGYSGGPSIDASMQFNHRDWCEASVVELTEALKGQGYRPAFIRCVKTAGRK